MKPQFKKISQNIPESVSCQNIRGVPHTVPKEIGFKNNNNNNKKQEQKEKRTVIANARPVNST